MATVGFVGLGNMGSALAANLVAAGHAVVAHDAAGSERCPAGATFSPDLATIARETEAVVLSLPDGAASQAVAGGLAEATERQATLIIDTSTIGVAAATAIHARLADSAIDYIDAPVSGGVAGARARSLLVMYAGSDVACTAAEPIIAGLSDQRRQVGDRVGMAQALKLANNFLSATALAATSEAIAFGHSVGLDMATMLDVLNASSGQSAATSDKFPRQVLTGAYAAGFANVLMAKDLRLYLAAVASQGAPSDIGLVTGQVWEGFAAAEPGADFTRIYPYVQAQDSTREM